MAAPRRTESADGHACRQRGTSLVELIAVILVFGILIGAAVPSLYGFMIANRMSDAIGNFTRSMMLARSEALKRNKPVRVCSSSNGSSCDTAVDWEAGWIVYVDANANGTFDAGDEAVRVAPGLSSGLTLRGSATVTHSVGFDTGGLPTATGWFALCNGGTLVGSRAMFVTAVGRIKLATDRDRDNVPEDLSGNDIGTCAP